MGLELRASVFDQYGVRPIYLFSVHALAFYVEEVSGASTAKTYKSRFVNISQLIQHWIGVAIAGIMLSLPFSMLKEYCLVMFVQYMFLKRIYASRELIRILYYSMCNKTKKLKNKTKPKPPNQRQTKKPPQPKKIKKILLMLFYFYGLHQRVAATV